MIAIEYPTVEVDGRKLVIRPSQAAFVLMRRRGIDPGQEHVLTRPNRVFDPQEPAKVICISSGNPNWVNNTYICFSCCVAENYIDMSQPHRVNLDMAPTADYWALKLPDYREVHGLYREAMGKFAEEQRTKLAAVPPMEAAS